MRRSTPFLIAMLMSAPAALAALTPAISYTNRGGSTNLGGYTIGYQFTTNVDARVTHLGYWDQSNDGNQLDHDVAIWDVNGSHSVPLVSGTVLTTDTSITSPGSANNGASNEVYYYHDTPDIILPAGGTYFIGAYVGGNVAGGGSSTPDGWNTTADNLLTIATAQPGGGPAITLLDYWDNNLNTSLAYPNRDQGSGSVYAGPN